MTDFRLVINFIFSGLGSLFSLILSNYILTSILMVSVFSLIIGLMNNINGKE